MLVLVCPASFKGTLGARRAAQALARGVADAGHEPVLMPLADGGEGTLDLLLASGGARHEARVRGPYGAEADAAWGALPDGTALVEMAQASGIHLAGPKPRALERASSYGTGQLLGWALASRPKALVVGLGGTATNDGGTGAMRALGVRFLDAAGEELEDAASLVRLARIDAPRAALAEVPVTCAADVDNPLTGEAGATRMFGPQKGGTPETLELLERAMRQYARVLGETFGRDVGASPGAGAAGGMGAALLAFFRARFVPGVDLVMDALGFDAAVAKADLLLTGEGRLDAQSLHGKVLAGVVRRARGKPVFALCGRVDLNDAQCRGWGLARAVGVSPASPPATPDDAEALLRRAASDELQRFRREA